MTYITASRPTHCSSPSILGRFAHFYAVWRQRQALKSLNNDALKDVGISHRDAMIETRRPFWDAPETWRC